MAKRCKECWGLNENPLLKFCRNHMNMNKQAKRAPIIQKAYTINKVSKTNKNTIAEFSQKTKDEIKARDKVCILTGNPIAEYHHAFFGAHDANFWPSRNDADQGVWLSAKAHWIIHHSPDTKLARIYRIKSILYLKKLSWKEI